MLISASRRTDIPACFSHWFFRRIEEGYVLVRNPMNPHQVSRVSLSPQDVDGIMFWTKNPLPMLAAGPGALKGYMYSPISPASGRQWCPHSAGCRSR